MKKLLSYIFRRINTKSQISKIITAVLLVFPLIILNLNPSAQPQSVLWFIYPVFINLYLLILFCYTLAYPPSFAEKYAKMVKKQLSHEEILYCRSVTKLWCIFFVINGGISLTLALMKEITAWALYNGVISYILIGAIFVIEYLYRRFVKKFSPTEQHTAVSQ